MPYCSVHGSVHRFFFRQRLSLPFACCIAPWIAHSIIYCSARRRLSQEYPRCIARRSTCRTTRWSACRIAYHIKRLSGHITSTGSRGQILETGMVQTSRQLQKVACYLYFGYPECRGEMQANGVPSPDCSSEYSSYHLLDRSLNCSLMAFTTVCPLHCLPYI